MYTLPTSDETVVTDDANIVTDATQMLVLIGKSVMIVDILSVSDRSRNVCSQPLNSESIESGGRSFRIIKCR